MRGAFKITLSDWHYDVGDIITWNVLDGHYGMIIQMDNKGINYVTCTVQPLKLSKWKWIRKIQTWILRKLLL